MPSPAPAPAPPAPLSPGHWLGRSPRFRGFSAAKLDPGHLQPALGCDGRCRSRCGVGSRLFIPAGKARHRRADPRGRHGMPPDLPRFRVACGPHLLRRSPCSGTLRASWSDLLGASWMSWGRLGPLGTGCRDPLPGQPTTWRAPIGGSVLRGAERRVQSASAGATAESRGVRGHVQGR